MFIISVKKVFKNQYQLALPLIKSPAKMQKKQNKNENSPL